MFSGLTQTRISPCFTAVNNKISESGFESFTQLADGDRPISLRYFVVTAVWPL
jgi:hypothetical protein